MLIARFARIDHRQLARLRRWLFSLDGRREELRDSYRRHQTRHELFFVVGQAPSLLLVLLSEVESIEQASASFLRSNLPIDVEFKSLVQEIANPELGVELVYDSRRFLAPPD